MANSTFIGDAKSKIIKELIKDADIVKAIDSPTISSKTPEKLIGTHLFNYNQNPNTINDVITFITVQVHIQSDYSFWGKNTYVHPSVEIWIISHEKHMSVDNIPKVTENRNDYISKLIDKKFNGKSGFGLGELTLVTNIEGSFQADYVYRKIVFQGTDLNNSLCDEE